MIAPAIGAARRSRVLSIGMTLAVAVALTACEARRYPPDPNFAAARGSSVHHGPVPPSHTVVAGDTVSGIARYYGLPTSSIIEANGLASPYTVRVGQVLTLPRVRTYVVNRGDTLLGIARGEGVPMTDLAAANGLTPPYRIFPGQMLIVPGSNTAATAVRTAEAPTNLQGSSSRGNGTAEIRSVSLDSPSTNPEAAESSPRGLTAARTGDSDVLPAAALPPPLASSGFMWPVGGTVTGPFGSDGNGLKNDGVNIAAPRGTPIVAAQNGTVTYAGENISGFGKLLLIRHDDGWSTAYAHSDVLLVKRGDRVARGQTIARVGSTGHVPSPQLHFEIRRDNKAVDPVAILKGPPPGHDPSQVAVQGGRPDPE